MIKPDKIVFKKDTGDLAVSFSEQGTFVLSSEYLRVHSPSAEVKGHGPGQEVLQWGKKNVRIEKLERSGNYAIRILFDDGHDTGIYSWDYLLDLGTNRESYWQAYLDRLDAEGRSRDPDEQIVKFLDP